MKKRIVIEVTITGDVEVEGVCVDPGKDEGTSVITFNVSDKIKRYQPSPEEEERMGQ